MLKFSKHKFFDKTFLRFILVGLINTLFGSAVMFIAYNVFSCGYWISSALNYILGSILSYFLNKYYTFQYKEQNWHTLLKFTLNIIICYFIAYSVAKPFALWLLSATSKSVQENIAMAIGVVIFTTLNYIGQRFYAFKK